ncbi:hypothetical protein BpHYR1_052633 [Brachionus plicatilis]|uniref:Uncharacterized protein n=1 Tax=Brachionus plicatilis TaxID=10195 RepID=A0A3M7Q3U8_BRAPC|nr:hypothetical protein BpHYR1_052633 [Brachionus plicatilis]
MTFKYKHRNKDTFLQKACIRKLYRKCMGSCLKKRWLKRFGSATIIPSHPEFSIIETRLGNKNISLDNFVSIFDIRYSRFIIQLNII